MKIFIDKEFRCHVENGIGRTPVDVPMFDGKCAAFVEGYKYIPAGETYTTEDGDVYRGEAMFPFKAYNALELAQKQSDEDDDVIGALMDEIEELCNELIGG